MTWLLRQLKKLLPSSVLTLSGQHFRSRRYQRRCCISTTTDIENCNNIGMSKICPLCNHCRKCKNSLCNYCNENTCKDKLKKAKRLKQNITALDQMFFYIVKRHFLLLKINQATEEGLQPYEIETNCGGSSICNQSRWLGKTEIRRTMLYQYHIRFDSI